MAWCTANYRENWQTVAKIARVRYRIDSIASERMKPNETTEKISTGLTSVFGIAKFAGAKSERAKNIALAAAFAVAEKTKKSRRTAEKNDNNQK